VDIIIYFLVTGEGFAAKSLAWLILGQAHLPVRFASSVFPSVIFATAAISQICSPAKIENIAPQEAKRLTAQVELLPPRVALRDARDTGTGAGSGDCSAS
jgi:hypothetical protein